MYSPISLNNAFLVPPYKTEGIKYAGSKLKLLPHILSIVQELDIKTILDGFSGSTRVSQMFAQLGYQVTANDRSVWSEIFGKTYLLNHQTRTYYLDLIKHLNNTSSYYGWFSEHYGGEIGSVEKRPFQLHNTMKLDGIRDEIDRLNLDEQDKAVALTSLILAMDAVDNTLGHYCAYLSNWSARSYNKVELKVPNLFISEQDNNVIQGDIFDLLPQKEFDLAYFDPPYGSNNEKMPPSRVRYNSYYHIWKTVVLNDHPQLFGKVNRREDSRDTVDPSVFEEYKKNEEGQYLAMLAIKRLIEETQAKYILLSYSSGGRATKQELYEILTHAGELVKVSEINHKTNVMGFMRWTNEWVTSDNTTNEYLFLLKK